MRTIVAVAQGVHTDLEDALEQRFGLLEAVVVDVEGDEPEILAGLGSAGATYLENTLTGGERLGISSWSQTLLAVVDRLQPLRVPGRGDRGPAGGRHGGAGGADPGQPAARSSWPSWSGPARGSRRRRCSWGAGRSPRTCWTTR